MTSTLTPSARRASARSGPALPPALHYTVHSVRLTAQNLSFVIFTVAMPVVLYVLFSQLFGSGPEDRLASAMIMVSMAAYGSLGAAMSGGAQLAVERRSGWFRQLMITTLPPQAFLWARATVILVLVLPALLLVFTAGTVLGGVRAPVTVWLTSLGLMWLGLIPLTVLGIVIGLWVKTEAVQGVTTLTLLVLALLGGLWLPTELFPSAMKGVSHLMPSYWLAEFGRWPFLAGTAFPWTGVLVLSGWSAVLTVLGALGYRRAVASSKR